MTNTAWDDLIFGEQDDQSDDLWELFHENSKTDQHEAFQSNDEIAARMARMTESIDYPGMPKFDLPPPIENFDTSLAQAMVSRVSPAELSAQNMSLEQLSSLLFYAYGVTRQNKDTGFLRPFRTVPSGGGLYPLEIYFSSKHIPGLPAGLYHYNPMKNHVRQVRENDQSLELSGGLVEFQQNLAMDTSIVFYITALFERTIFKYGNRGYRFVLFEAGHVAQNLNLVASAMGLGVLNIGGYYDRKIDDMLELDGLNHSTIYMVGVGNKEAVHEDPVMPSGAAEPA